MASAQEVLQGLMARGIPRHIALGIAGNMSVESDGFQTDVNEYAPVVPGSRGGYGLNQWTGPRRTQFEQFAAKRGTSPDDLDTQLDFTLWELANTEARAGEALSAAKTPEEAARIYSEQFLRPGIPHLDRRIEATNALAGLQSAPQNAFAGQQSPQPQGNALAAMERPQTNYLDPRAFMTAAPQRGTLAFT